ncbi:MAG: VrrA/YqfQ family protein, partial [Paenisporosarcina sp.]
NPFSQGQYQQPRNPFSQGQYQQPRNPFSQGQYQQPRNPFSFLQNRFSGGPPTGPRGFGNNGYVNSSQPPFQGGGLPSRMEQYLQTAERFMSTAQQFTPMVKQVAPMVQNIPALWKIYRGFQNMPDAAPVNTAVRSATSAATSFPNGTSQPRIFQPPV